jgi:uncharacterized protein YjbI with pentapeptide repeats
MLAAAAAVVITAFLVTIWLWAIASHAKPGTDQASARLDAVRTGLAAGAGAGAAVGLMLAFRRQHHQEIATDLTDRDATERRITELYAKAVEQLGSDKAPVRLGGLYALERLAQDNPAQRQTIVNVICAYLRMPFAPAAPTGKPEPEATEAPEAPAAGIETRTAAPGDTWQQERQVRLTAQRILADHLRDERAEDERSADPPSPRFWPDIRLQLVGATLIDFDLEYGVMADASFSEATFSGEARFEGATFSGEARFDHAVFSGIASFSEATFSGDALFDYATFNGAIAFFNGTVFRGDALFGSPVFRDAMFHGAVFRGEARFDGTTFNDEVGFYEAAFSSAARFDGATFGSVASFDGATFSGDASALSFDESRVLSPGTRRGWPTGWCVGPDGSGGYTVVRANDGNCS